MFVFRVLLRAIGIATVLLSSSGHAEDNLVSFFNGLYDDFSAEYAVLTRSDYQQFCREFGLDQENSHNQRIFGQISFYHDLFTGHGASDCARGGILQIPYFWHWIEPNPRYEIMRLPDSILLNTVPPPPQFSRYETFADIDRVPSLFLSDLVKQQPGYTHPDCGDFFTFGWCSEREMALTSLLTTLGFSCKIRQAGIHVWTEVRSQFAATDSASIAIIARVDNTFDEGHGLYFL